MTLSRIVDDRGVVTGYVSTSEDVTDRVRVHDALVDALETERRAVERLREVDHVKDTFISTVSHELRTPITSITGYLELLLDGGFGELDGDQADALRRVDGNSRRLLSLIDDLLTLSRVHEDGLGLIRGEVDLATVVRTAYDVVAPAWAQRDLAVALEVPADPVLITGDEDMLERVVVNLLSNAVKFTPDGGHATVRLRTADDEALLEVEDTGIGIPADEQDRLFTRFFRASTAQDRAIPGSGLGLSIAGAIVESHGGRMEVESADGDGTTFRAHLPRG
jgi:signal transduction histidine kinase